MNAGFRSEKGKYFSCGMLSISQGRQLCAFNGFSAGQSWNIWKLSVLPAGHGTPGRVFRKRGRAQDGRIWGTPCGSPLIWSLSPLKTHPLFFLQPLLSMVLKQAPEIHTESKKNENSKTTWMAPGSFSRSYCLPHPTWTLSNIPSLFSGILKFSLEQSATSPCYWCSIAQLIGVFAETEPDLLSAAHSLTWLLWTLLT